MKNINITFCSCNKYVYRNQWKPYKNLKELVSNKIRDHYPRAKLDFSDFKIPDVPKQKIENEIIAKVKDKEHVVKIMLKLAKCSLCEKEGTQYYEAILQVRSSSIDVLEKSIELLKQRIENLRQRGVFINKVKRFDQGYDLYLTNRRLCQSLGRELYEQFGGVFKASPRLFSRNRQTSKNIYRLNVLIRLPGFEKGDVIVTTDDQVFKIEKLGKKIKLFNLDKNSVSNIDYSKLKYHILPKHKTYVSKLHPDFEVIDPLDYQSTVLKNEPRKGLILGDEVVVVLHKGIYVTE